MVRCKILIALFLMITCSTAQGQSKDEREYRIKKNQFPKRAHSFIDIYLGKARKLKYYRETDSAKTSYNAKFKLDRLRYSAEFDRTGQLKDIEILIKEVDIPNESLENMNEFLSTTFSKYRILKLQQQYPVSANEAVEETIRNAMQNLLLPSIRYKIMVAAKKDNGFEDYEIFCDSEGNFIRMRKSPPPNYDHILY